MSGIDLPARDEPQIHQRRLRQYGWVVFIFLFVGWVGGKTAGRSIGSDYKGVGLASGEQIGELLAWGFSVGMMLVAAELAGRLPYFRNAGVPSYSISVLVCIWLWLVLWGGALAAAQIYGGRPLWWGVLIGLGVPYAAAVFCWMKELPSEERGQA